MALSEQETAARYEEAAATYGAALERLARAYEPNPDLRRDLLQEIHLALWRSLAAFDGCCSLRTWIYRVAHNTATSQVFRRRNSGPAFVGLDELAATDARVRLRRESPVSRHGPGTRRHDYHLRHARRRARTRRATVAGAGGQVSAGAG
jgi:DNA-directed RNA polymerase specialized sigma24 family protein